MHDSIINNDMNNIFYNLKNVEKLKNKNILITGATGMLGIYCSYFLFFLNEKYNYNIHIFLLARNLNKLNKKIGNNHIFIPVIQNITNPINIDHDIDYIIHTASSADPKTLSEQPLSVAKNNILGLYNIVDLANTKKSEIFFTSTREIYGQMSPEISSISEQDMGSLDCLAIRSCYPESKRMCENILACNNFQNGTNYKIARLAHVYGPGMTIHNDGRVMPDLLSCFLDNRNIILKSSGEALRAFCYVADAICAIFSIILNGEKNNVYNISNEHEEISIKDLAQKLCDMHPTQKIKIVFQIENDNKKYLQFKRTKLDNTKIEQLGFEFFTDLSTGLTQTINFYKNNPQLL